MPVVWQMICSLNHKAGVILFFSKRNFICTIALLVGGKHTIVEICYWRTIKAKVESLEAIVVEIYIAILIIYRRAEERITHGLSPMLPTWVNIVVVIVIIATNMVFITLRMVVIYWSTLIFTAYILYNHSFEPLMIFQL